MYSDLIFGNTSRPNLPQCGQVAAAYSVIVSGALAAPSAMSGSDTGFATSDAPCAIALAIRRSGENPASAASPVNDRAAVKARRVINTAGSPGPAMNDGRSALQQRFDLGVEYVERRFALDDVAVDEEGRRGVHLQNVGGVFLVGGDL